MIVRYALVALFVTGVFTTHVSAQTVVTGTMPSNATIVFHHLNQIYVMTAAGARTRLTVDTTRTYEHLAVSPDRQYLVANYFATDGVSHLSKLILYDLTARTARTLVPQFVQAGNGGVDWDQQGRIYFSGVQTEPFPAATTDAQYLANAGATEIWRMRPDGSGLEQLTHTSDRAEGDVSVHANGMAFAYTAFYLPPNPADYRIELWVRGTNDAGVQKVFTALDAQQTVHDPEFSPDGTQLVFSMRNVNFVNFPDNPGANTAQDIYKIKLDGTGLTRLSSLGLISICPDWVGNEVLYLQASDRTAPPWSGLVIR